MGTYFCRSGRGQNKQCKVVMLLSTGHLCGILFAILGGTNVASLTWPINQDFKTPLKRSDPLLVGTESNEPYVDGIGERVLLAKIRRYLDENDSDMRSQIRKSLPLPLSYYLSKRDPYDFGIGK